MIRRRLVPNSTNVRVTFTLPSDDPKGAVSLVGDFNAWTPGANPMVYGAEGSRSTSLVVASGSTLRFRYLGENGRWFDDPDADGLDEHGGCVQV